MVEVICYLTEFPNALLIGMNNGIGGNVFEDVHSSDEGLSKFQPSRIFLSLAEKVLPLWREIQTF